MENSLFYVTAALAVLFLSALVLLLVWDRRYRKLKQALEQSIKREESAGKREKIYGTMLPNRLLKLFQKKDTGEVCIGEGKKIRAAVLSFNMSGFSAMTRSQTAEEIFRFVNGVLSQAIPHVLFQDGAIERFVDAGFRAFYLNAPERALRSAVSICESVNQAEHIQQDYSIGLSYGDVMAGMVGHENRLGLLTISETTGIAEFLQELAERCGARILISGSLKKQIPDFEKHYNSRYLGCIYLKAANAMEDLYDVYDGDGPEDKNGKRRTRLLFEKGVELFQSHRFYDARNHFIEVLKANRMDGAAREYLYLCNRYESQKEKDAPIYLEVY